ncbi:Phospholipase D gamma 1 [Orchesella cincta]|uniref:Phospholipase D gamma 1 n=1 Tax=Orchesella cincta TaxID=48709 RepID=A0A1D2NMZ5_ORCCI|nr:Phospholipase D gamma 1 [Orchesella cincta]
MNYFAVLVLVSYVCAGVHSLPIDEIRKEDQSIKSNSSISISFYATELSGCDLISACDASVTILCSSIYTDWKICGQTKRIRNSNNPVWPEAFEFEHVSGSSQRWRFDLKDHNLFGTKLMGSFSYSVDEYADMKENLIQNDVPENRGVLWVQRLEEDGNV